MSRDIPPALETAIDAPVVRPFYAVRVELPDPVYAWSGRGTLSFADSGGTTRSWIGTGEFGAIDSVGENTEGSAAGVRVTLLNAPADFRDDIAEQATRGALFEVYVGALNETYQVVEAVHLLWRGKVDKYEIVDSGASISVEVSGESRAIDQKRPAIKRFTDEYQQRMHPGDKFFEYVPRMTEVQILWAKAELGTAGVGGGGGGGIGGALSSWANVNSY